MAVTYRVREKYFILNSGNVKKDWQIFIMDIIFTLAGQGAVQSENFAQPPPVSPPFASTTTVGSDERFFASSTQHDTAY